MKSLNNNHILAVINPKAGRKRIIGVSERFSHFRNRIDYAVFSEVNEFRDFMREQASGYEIVVAAGGDGTVNSVASELADTGKILAVLPVGSGNGFAREMGFSRWIGRLLRDAGKITYREVDIIYLNDKICVNAAGVGVDSFVAHEFSSYEKRGFWSYVAAIFRIIWSLKPVRIKAVINEREIEEDVFMFSITNNRQFGNNAIICPAAAPDDGKMNIVIVKPFPFILLPVYTLRLLTGTLKESRYINYYETDKPVKISTSESRFHIDGEPHKLSGEITVTIRPKALRVLNTGRCMFEKRS